ncbi:MAG: NAD-dependent epimerase/dehydratase family protein [Pseudomonadota bacterium]
MAIKRREVLKAGLVGAALAGTRIGTACESLNVLILGGTGFIGPHMVEEALRRGHNLTLFNRGRTNTDLFPDVEKIKGDRANDHSEIANRKWDVVIDNSGYVPRHVETAARVLSPNINHYVFISTISVYESFATPNHEDSPLAQLEDETVEEVTGETYGGLKALCEQRAADVMGDDRLTVLRPTYICGPGDHTDRFSYWPVRTARGGEMIWPGGRDYPVQIIDVRDLARFTFDCVEERIAGIYNMVNPAGSYTMGDLLDDSVAASGAEIDPIWVDESFIDAAREEFTVRNRGMFPIWHPLDDEYGAVSSISDTRAKAAGLKARPVRETIEALLAWWQTLPEERQSDLRAGLPADIEVQLIERWKTSQAES